MSDRIVCITGAYGNLGRCFARAFIAAGDRVVLTGRRQEPLAAAARELGADHHQRLDVCDRQQIADLHDRLAERYGRLDVLINNAARMGAGGRLEAVDAEAFAQMLHTNICGPMFCTQGLLPLLRRSAAPLVLNIASTSGHRADAQSAAYNASKFGLLGFTEAIRKDLRRDGIRVSSLSPSSIDFSDDAPQAGHGARLHGDDIAAAARHLADLPPRALVRDVEMWACDP